jgi:hypothetical protein
MQESHASWQSMTPKERANVIFEFEAEIRKKRRADNGKLKGVDNYDVIREMVNVDVPKMIEEELLSDLDLYYAWRSNCNMNYKIPRIL